MTAIGAPTHTGVVCDVGGTVLLTDALHRNAWERALSEQGLLTDDNVRRAFGGLEHGWDSFATARSLPVSERQAEAVARRKQAIVQVPIASKVNPAVLAWLEGQGSTPAAAISHSDQAWTRDMLELAGVLERFSFVLGRTNGRVSKAELLLAAVSELGRRFGVARVAYCGDTEFDRDLAARLRLPYVDANGL